MLIDPNSIRECLDEGAILLLAFSNCLLLLFAFGDVLEDGNVLVRTRDKPHVHLNLPSFPIPGFYSSFVHAWGGSFSARTVEFEYLSSLILGVYICYSHSPDKISFAVAGKRCELLVYQDEAAVVSHLDHG